MNTRFLKQAFVLLLCSLFFAGTALWLVSVKEPRSYGGEPVFAKTLQNLDNLGRLTIETPKTVVNLQLEDNLWRVMEIGNYYAGYRQINNLFNDFADARIYRRRGPATDADEKKFGLDDNAFRVITRDAGGQILNSVLIGKAAADNLYHFARIEGEKDVFLITGNFSFPETAVSWLQQPLLSLSPADIRSLKIGQETAVRPDIIIPFRIKGKQAVPDISRYLNALGFVAAYDVRRSADFDRLQFSAPKSLTVTTFDGLVVTIEVYGRTGEEYWASLKFSTTTLPTTAVNDYIKSSAFLYEDWYFRLAPDVGRILFNAFIQ